MEKPKINIFDPNAIIFYDENYPYYIFSNFNDAYPFKIKKITYKTPIHYYESQRFSDWVTQQRIINAQTARMASQISDSNKNLYLPNIDKNNIMLAGLRGKFSQYPELATALIATNPKNLINHTLEDNYWADGGDGSGSNTLGKLLEQIRTELLNGTLSSGNPYYG